MCLLWCYQVVEEYNQREREIKEMEKELEEKTKDLNTYRQNISEAWLSSSTHHTHDGDYIIYSFINSVCVCTRQRSAGWSPWSCWWIRLMRSSVTFFAPWTVLEKWTFTLRMRSVTHWKSETGQQCQTVCVYHSPQDFRITQMNTKSSNFCNILFVIF